MSSSDDKPKYVVFARSCKRCENKGVTRCEHVNDVDIREYHEIPLTPYTVYNREALKIYKEMNH